MEHGQKEQDPYNLQRFVEAQTHDYPYATVRAELQAGQKHGHWMWYIFPQLKGLGSTSRSMHYGISGKAEAQAYLSHCVLGPRLRECTKLVIAVEGRTIEQIFSTPDNLKFRSCMTLFSKVTSDNHDFILALRKYYEEQLDPATLRYL